MARRRYTEKEKTAFLSKFESGAGSAAAFCRKHKLGYHTFLKWRSESSGEATRAAQSTQFVELEVKREKAECAGPGAGVPAVELVLGGGMVLRIYRGQGS